MASSPNEIVKLLNKTNLIKSDLKDLYNNLKSINLSKTIQQRTVAALWSMADVSRELENLSGVRAKIESSSDDDDDELDTRRMSRLDSWQSQRVYDENQKASNKYYSLENTRDKTRKKIINPEILKSRDVEATSNDPDMTRNKPEQSSFDQEDNIPNLSGGFEEITMSTSEPLNQNRSPNDSENKQASRGNQGLRSTSNLPIKGHKGDSQGTTGLRSTSKLSIKGHIGVSKGNTDKK